MRAAPPLRCGPLPMAAPLLFASCAAALRCGPLPMSAPRSAPRLSPRMLLEVPAKEPTDLIGALLQRTELNREANAAQVRKMTEQNAYTAIEGSVSKRLLTDESGRNVFLTDAEVSRLTRQGRVACAPSVAEPCRLVPPMGGRSADGAETGLPTIKKLVCAPSGRDCKFTEEGE